MQQQLNAQKLASDSKNTKLDVHKADSRTAPKVASFDQDKKVDAGTWESNQSESVADTGQSWGDQQSDSGTFENNPDESPSVLYDNGANQGYQAEEGGYDEDAYEEEGYDEDAYDEEGAY